MPARDDSFFPFYDEDETEAARALLESRVAMFQTAVDIASEFGTSLSDRVAIYHDVLPTLLDIYWEDDKSPGRRNG
jgi:hypothetical protein